MSRISSTFKKTKGAGATKVGTTYLTDVPRGRSPSPLRRSDSSNSLRKSRTGPLNKSLSSSAELKSIENGYIKNLQQQVYFLELEANYLREQAKKATDMHPQMTAEAERMLYKLRNMQENVDDLNLEVRRREATLDVVQNEKDRVLTKLEQEEIERQRDKRILTEEIAELRRERDRLALENTRKSTEVDHVSTDKENLQIRLLNSEDTVRSLRGQLNEKTEQCKLIQIELETKRSQLVEAEVHARDVEDKYITNTAVIHDRTVNDLREELRSLRIKLKESELRADEDRRLRGRVETESSDILQDNTLLNSELDELKRQFSRERELRETTDLRRSQNLAELSLLSDKERDLQSQLRSTAELLRQEKLRSDGYLQQLSKQESVSNTLEIDNTTTRGKLYETEGKSQFLDSENKQLKRDKELLIDHVAELQRQLSRKDVTLATSRRSLRELESDLDNVEHTRYADSTVQSHKWKEFETLADSMKSLSRSMARSTSPPRSPRSSMRTSKKMGKGMYAL